MSWLDSLIVLDNSPFAALPRYLIALGIGLLLGIERERKAHSPAGIRTFALTAMFGTLNAQLANQMQLPFLALGGLGAVAVFILAAYRKTGAADTADTPDVTTQVALVLAYSLGMMVWLDGGKLAVALGIITTSLLYLKPELQRFSHRLTRHDIYTLLQFLVFFSIILPLVPNRQMGPFNAINPYEVWLMVVLISGIGLAGYLAVLIIGNRSGAWLLGILGGLVSSTATSVTYSRQAAHTPEALPFAAAVIRLANMVVFVRIGFLAALLAPGLLPTLLPPLAIAGLAGLVITLWAGRQPAADNPAHEFRLSNPVEIPTALLFGVMFAVVGIAIAALTDWIGVGGLYLVAAVSGLTDIDAIVLSSFRQYADGRLLGLPVGLAIAIALLANSAFKLGLVSSLGGRTLARQLVPVLLVPPLLMLLLAAAMFFGQ
ncbi:MgtC/SapB family protein [Laribacter hongkongensis]|uniref:MgtC/SapB family protein n=1 Tax=Laribacter hongkongensis TaxID=168471 RepID=UPI001EFDB91F|nr:MgtC/SapB family protein [Laribacter hongkongensis]MCG9096167.1 MgtC/SapB family protein [Laribacter hongkongensis]MCG9098818.1 MgtC/SapB family protein [Laribacter hongkongensis]